ncbi:hypothetical protein [Thiocapsa marina]|uniref:Uncharacterized protein n=1 Tax=Thiocapsa marina 5811 TaxID=768671 RepID=F9UF23_9GAMM|nr:hypothetical protein [Thiocapsa marina]EGV17060.1 hypothetical protein ThimaDRAFT_3526 [Thiocapsa marina 5811]
MTLKRLNVLVASMNSPSVRSTLYREPARHQVLRLKAASARRSLSEIVNDAIRKALREEQENPAAFAERVGAGFGGGAVRTIPLSLYQQPEYEQRPERSTRRRERSAVASDFSE